MAPELIVFDFDGTLADTKISICGALALCVRGTPAERSAESFEIWLGQPIGQILDSLKSECPDLVVSYEDFVQQFRGHERRLAESTVRLFPGARGLLEGLSAPLAIASTKPTERLLVQAGALGVTSLFAHIQGTDGFPHKPSPEILFRVLGVLPANPEHCVFVGDTTTDMGAAVAGGFRGVGVSWGAHDPESLLRAGASLVVHSFDELRDAIDG